MLSRLLSVVALVSLFGAVSGQEPIAVEAFIRKCEQAKPQAIADIKADLEAAQSELSAARAGTVNKQATRPMKLANGRTVFPTAKAKSEAVADADRKQKAAKDRLAAIERADKLFIPVLPGAYNVGDVGRVERGEVEVIQVIDASNMLVTGSIGSDKLTRGETGYEGGPGLIREPAPKRTAWIRGIPTGSYADAMKIDLAGKVLSVTGNKTYPNAAGVSQTVLLLDAVNAEAAERAWNERRGK